MLALLLVSSLAVGDHGGDSSVVAQESITRTTPPPMYASLRIGMTKAQVQDVLKENSVAQLTWNLNTYSEYFVQAKVIVTFNRKKDTVILFELSKKQWNWKKGI